MLDGIVARVNKISEQNKREKMHDRGSISTIVRLYRFRMMTQRGG